MVNDVHTIAPAKSTTKIKKPKGVDDWTIQAEELDQLIKTHHGTLDDVLMTPTMAAYILKRYNTGNRHLRNNHANGFAETLKRGGWENTGEAVVFAREGILNNGQHRLEGIVRSGIPAVMDIRFGISRKAFAITDTGAKRQAGDVLSISGSRSPFASAATIRMLLAYKAGLPSSYNSTSKVGNAEILEAYNNWPDVEAAILITKGGLSRRGFVNAASNAFTFLAIRQSNVKTVEEFLELVETGLTKTKNDAPRLLRERILSDGQTFGRGTRESIVERFALFIKAWNFWRAGERPAHLRWRTGEAFPEIKVNF
ncbi:unnamed protein product [Sphagnum tenellum]